MGKNKSQVKVQTQTASKFPCYECGRVTVDPEGCPVHKVVKKDETLGEKEDQE